MSKWLDITTAPKDGTDILVYGILRKEIGNDGEFSTVGKCQWFGGGLTEQWICSDSDHYLSWYDNVTHWRPLPAPPIEL
jgi:Protein of unknown function (DUF551)